MLFKDTCRRLMWLLALIWNCSESHCVWCFYLRAATGVLPLILVQYGKQVCRNEFLLIWNKLLKGCYCKIINVNKLTCCCCFFRIRHLAWKTRKGPNNRSSSRTLLSKWNMDNRVHDRLASAFLLTFLYTWVCILFTNQTLLSLWLIVSFASLLTRSYEPVKSF